MNISKEKIEELRKTIKDDFGEELTDQEAHDAAFNLVGFYDMLMQCVAEDIQDYIKTGKLSPEPSPDGKLSGHDQWIVSEAERLKKQLADKVRPA